MTEPEVSWAPRFARGARLARDRVRGVDLLLVPERVIRLNRTASAVLGMCDGTRTVDGIAEALDCACRGPGIREDLVAFLHRARRERWLT